MEKKNRTIGQRLHRVFRLNMRSIWIVVIVVFFLLFRVGHHIWDFYSVSYLTERLQMETRKDVQTINKRLLIVLISEDEKVTKEHTEEISSRLEKMDGYIKVIMQNLDDESLNRALENTLQDFKNASWEMLSLAGNGDYQGVLTYYHSTHNVISEKLADTLGEIGALVEDKLLSQFRLALGSLIVVALLLLVLAGISTLMSARRSRKLAADIDREVGVLEMVSEQMAEGNISNLLDFDKDNTIASVAPTLRKALERIILYIEEIKVILAKMEEGNFNIRFAKDFQGDFRKIQTSLENFALNTSAGMRQIINVSETVSGGAEQIASAGNLLSESCEAQTWIVDEFSQNLSNIAEILANNVEYTTTVCSEVSAIANGMVEGDRKMQEMVNAMNTIDQTAHEINEIIVSINEIADQTNLLSLNATIESARAGEAGRGFAIVASEVSALAGQSAIAAKNSSELIEASLRAVREGKEIADRMAEDLGAMAKRVEPIFEQMDQLVRASKEQEEAIKNLEKGIEKITNIGETNAATAQESAALSNEFNEQAGVLKGLIDRFEVSNRQ